MDLSWHLMFDRDIQWPALRVGTRGAFFSFADSNH